jgi:hypothetical protein
MLNRSGQGELAFAIGQKLGKSAAPFCILVVLLLAFRGVIDFVTILPFEEPIFVFTHPFTIFIFVFFFYIFAPNVSDRLMIVIALLCLPIFASIAIFMVSFISSDLFESIGVESMRFSEYYHSIYTFYFGDLADKFKYFTISERLSSTGNYNTLMTMLNIITGIILFAVYSTINHFTIGTIANISGKREYQGLPTWLEAPLTLIIIGLCYFAIFPMVQFAHFIPFGFGINIALAWCLMLLPILGIILSLVNCRRSKKDKVGTPITLFYICFVLFFWAYIIMNPQNSLQYIYYFFQGAEPKNMNIIFMTYLYAVPIVFLVLFVFSLIKEPGDDKP